MLKHGYSGCATCHVDPAGGELLTPYGRVISQELLSTSWSRARGAAFESSSAGTGAAPSSGAADSDEEAFYQPFFGAVRAPEALLLGGSVRVASLYRDTERDRFRVFPMQVDLYGDARLFEHLHVGGSLGVAKVPVGSPHARAAQVTSNQGDGYNLLSRTHYVRYEFGDGAHHLSVGRLNLPFGLRMSEHVMWVRSETATDRESDQQHGVSLNLGFDRLRVELMGILGNYQLNPDKLRKRGYSGSLEFDVTDRVVVGASSLITHAGADLLNPSPITDTRQAHGGFLRANLGRQFVLLAEGDLLLHTQHKPGYVGFAQLDFEAVRGFHLLGTGEVLDSGYPKAADANPRAPGEGKPKFGGWLSAAWFFVSHFDFRLDTIVREDEPVQLLGQIHVYL